MADMEGMAGTGDMEAMADTEVMGDTVAMVAMVVRQVRP